MPRDGRCTAQRERPRGPGRATGWLATVLAAAAMVTTLSPAVGGAQAGQEVQAEAFVDLGEAGVHESAARELAGEGVFDGTGCAPERLCPLEPLARWAMAVWLVRVLDGEAPAEVDGSRFADVDAARWWSPYVERLADLEVTRGCATEPLRFCPHDAVSRAQMASFLVRAFKLADADPAGFSDVDGEHAASIDALAAAGVTTGCRTDPPRYCPSRKTTRAQMASFLVRARNIDSEQADGEQADGEDGGAQAGQEVQAEAFVDLGEAGVHESAARELAGEGVFDGTGCAPERLCPLEPLARWAMAVWLVRVLDGEAPAEVDGSRFADVDAARRWSPYVERLADLEVTRGCATEPLRFCPHDAVSRAQMASFLVRAFKLADRGPRGLQRCRRRARRQHRRARRGRRHHGLPDRPAAVLPLSQDHPGPDGELSGASPQHRQRTSRRRRSRRRGRRRRGRPRRKQRRAGVEAEAAEAAEAAEEAEAAAQA